MLTMFQRAENYVLQNAMGGRSKPYRLTASQQRRIRQGERKALPTGGKVHRKPVQARLSADFSEVVTAMDILSTVDDTSDTWIDAMSIPNVGTPENYCPRCGAVDDEECVTPKGKATKTHKGRGE